MINLLVVVGKVALGQHEKAASDLIERGIVPTVLRMSEDEWQMKEVEAPVHALRRGAMDEFVREAMMTCYAPITPGSRLAFPLQDIVNSKDSIKSLAAALVARTHLQNNTTQVVAVVMTADMQTWRFNDAWLVHLPDATLYVQHENGWLETC